MMSSSSRKVRFVCMRPPVYLGDRDIDLLTKTIVSWPFISIVFRQRFQMVLDMIKFPIISVLEIGYGAGFLAYALAPYVGRYTGIDIHKNPHLVGDMFKDRGIDNVEFKTCDARDLSIFPPSSFDLVISVSCLEHIADHRNAQEQIERVLTPSGQAVYGLPIKNITTKAFFKLNAYDDSVVHPTTHRDVIESAIDKGLFLDKERFFPFKGTIFSIYWVGRFKKKC